MIDETVVTESSLTASPHDLRLKRRHHVNRTVLLIVLIVLLLAVLPTWPYSGGWGYYPSGGLGLVVLILIILLLLGRI